MEKLRDLVGICLECADLNLSYKNMKDSMSPFKGLAVKANATHSDKIINRRIYLFDKVLRGAQSFIKPFKKPVLTFHNDETGEPIGRVITAQFVPTMDEQTLKLQPMLIKKDLYVSYLSDNFLFKDGYQGTGKIELGLDITDKQSIEKVMDERYLTLSVGFDSSQMMCNLCWTDWIKEGPCDHIPGTVFEGSNIFSVMGDMVYNEISFVNRPADAEAQVVARGLEAEQAIWVHPYNSDSIKEKLSYFKDSVEEFDMFKEMVDSMASGSKLKLEDLFMCEDMDEYDLYQKLAVDGKYALNKEAYDSLPEATFCGISKSLPLVDLAHFNAIKDFLKGFEDTKEKERTINRLYYRAKKMGLLPSNPKTAVFGDVTLNLTTPEDMKDSYKELVEKDMVKMLGDAENELTKIWKDRMEVLNLTEEDFKSEQPQGDAKKEVINEEVKEEIKPSTEDSSDSKNKDVTPESLYTMFNEMADEAKEEFRSLIDTNSGDLLKLNDEVVALKNQIRDRETDELKRKAYVAVLEDKLVNSKKSIVQTILDFKVALNKPGTEDGKEAILKELMERTFESLIDTLKDLRQEMFEFASDPVKETKVDTKEKSRRNDRSEVDTNYRTEPLDFNDFAKFFFNSALRQR